MLITNLDIFPEQSMVANKVNKLAKATDHSSETTRLKLQHMQEKENYNHNSW